MTIGETTMIEENEQEVEVEDQEQDYGSDVETMLAAIQQKNLQQAKNHFEDIIGDKVHVSLEAEKVRLANVVYNGSTEEADEVEDEVEMEMDEVPSEDAEWEDITAEIEDSLE
jgi:outer membrane protein assembly factor BamD (BamD/ComL family)